MFENIVGNNQVKETLKQSIKTEKTSHSYMFIGTDGIGKKLIAKEFAKTLLCLNKKENCNSCESCIKFITDNNPDFILIEPQDGNIKIDQIRNMQVKVAEKPIISNKKIYIIDNADTMTMEAQNCLLKTLEEPPQYVTIILIGTNESNFLSTIKSRCTIIHFNNIENDELKMFLEKNYNMNDLNEKIINIFGGSIGKAIKLKDKSELYKNIDNIIENLKRYDIIDLLKVGDIFYKSKEEILDLLEYTNILLLQFSKKDYEYANCISVVEETKKRIKMNANYNMCIDYMLLKWNYILGKE